MRYRSAYLTCPFCGSGSIGGGIFEDKYKTVQHALGYDCARQMEKNIRNGTSKKYLPPTKESIKKLGEGSPIFLRLLERKIDFMSFPHRKKPGVKGLPLPRNQQKRKEFGKPLKRVLELKLEKTTNIPRERPFTSTCGLYFALLANVILHAVRFQNQ